MFLYMYQADPLGPTGAFEERVEQGVEQGVIDEILMRTLYVLGLQDAPLYDLEYLYPRLTASVQFIQEKERRSYQYRIVIL